MTKEILDQMGIAEDILEKVLIILNDSEFYDVYGDKYDSPILYYNCGWILQDACTEKEFNLEDYGKTYARTIEDFKLLKQHSEWE